MVLCVLNYIQLGINSINVKRIRNHLEELYFEVISWDDVADLYQEPILGHYNYIQSKCIYF